MSQHSPSYSFTIRLRYPDRPGLLGRITSTIGDADGLIGAVDIVDVRDQMITRDITINATDVDHGQRVSEHVEQIPGVEVLSFSDRTFLVHLGGKIEVTSKVSLKTRDDLSMAYTPGVARVCRAIADEPEKAFTLTCRKNTVAVVTDGSAVLGLGSIGPEAALPVMEGKAILFKEFGGVDAFPICLNTQDVEEIVNVVAAIAPTFGGINLEDISSPRCVEIERRLSEVLDVPVFHDDQHGTAIVVLAALTNALKVVGKSIREISVALNGTGAAGMAIAKLLKRVGVESIIGCDRQGAIYAGRPENSNAVKLWFAEHTNHEHRRGSLSEIIQGADVFVGVSSGNVMTESDVKAMAKDPIVFALANPDPEINPSVAMPHVRVMATGRSDYPNQINNVLCFPGFFRGLFDTRARVVSESMKIAAAQAIANVIGEQELLADYIIPSVFDRRVSQAVAAAVSRCAIEEGFARRTTLSGIHED